MSAVRVRGQPVEIMERVGETEFNIDQNRPHIVVDASICRRCPHQMCQYGCPTQCYKADEADRKVMSYVTPGVWFDIWTVSEHERATAAIQANPELFKDA